MLIKTENYLEYINKIGVENLSSPIKKMHDLIVRITSDGKDWSKFQTYKSAWEKQFEAVELLFRSKTNDKPAKTETKIEPKKQHETKPRLVKPSDNSMEEEAHTAARKLIEEYVKRGDSIESLMRGQMGSHNGEFSASIKGRKIYVSEINDKKVDFTFSLDRIYNEIKSGIKSPKHVPHSHHKHAHHEKPKVKGKEVELVSPEVIFIKRYALLNGREKNKQQVLNFIKGLQKAIVERKIKKKSRYAHIIEHIQKQLVSVYNKMDEVTGFSFTGADLAKYLKIAGAEHLMPSVRFIKSYIGMEGKAISKEKANNLFEKIKEAIEKRYITPADKYMKHIRIILGSLERFLKKEGEKALTITDAQLNGLAGILEGCGCNLHGSAYRETYGGGLEGVEETETAPKNTILNSQEVIDLKPDKLNFEGKWLEFIGNPSRGFTAMIFGRPKFGKSYLALEFAGYLARNHGKVLYVAREEGFDDTLQQKLKDKNVVHDNLFVSDYLPANLNEYDFVFFDSVNKLALSPNELEKLERKYPGISFIYVFQTNKDGVFKGAMQFQHNVDSVIEVPEKGLAVQYGRYNQGGQMQIFG